MDTFLTFVQSFVSGGETFYEYTYNDKTIYTTSDVTNNQTNELKEILENAEYDDNTLYLDTASLLKNNDINNNKSNNTSNNEESVSGGSGGSSGGGGSSSGGSFTYNSDAMADAIECAKTAENALNSLNEKITNASAFFSSNSVNTASTTDFGSITSIGSAVTSIISDYTSSQVNNLTYMKGQLDYINGLMTEEASLFKESLTLLDAAKLLNNEENAENREKFAEKYLEITNFSSSVELLSSLDNYFSKLSSNAVGTDLTVDFLKLNFNSNLSNNEYANYLNKNIDSDYINYWSSMGLAIDSNFKFTEDAVASIVSDLGALFSTYLIGFDDLNYGSYGFGELAYDYKDADSALVDEVKSFAKANLTMFDNVYSSSEGQEYLLNYFTNKNTELYLDSDSVSRNANMDYYNYCESWNNVLSSETFSDLGLNSIDWLNDNLSDFRENILEYNESNRTLYQMEISKEDAISIVNGEEILNPLCISSDGKYYKEMCLEGEDALSYLDSIYNTCTSDKYKTLISVNEARENYIANFGNLYTDTSLLENDAKIISGEIADTNNRYSEILSLTNNQGLSLYDQVRLVSDILDTGITYDTLDINSLSTSDISTWLNGGSVSFNTANSLNYQISNENNNLLNLNQISGILTSSTTLNLLASGKSLSQCINEINISNYDNVATDLGYCYYTLNDSEILNNLVSDVGLYVTLDKDGIFSNLESTYNDNKYGILSTDRVYDILNSNIVSNEELLKMVDQISLNISSDDILSSFKNNSFNYLVGSFNSESVTDFINNCENAASYFIGLKTNDYASYGYEYLVSSDVDSEKQKIALQNLSLFNSYMKTDESKEYLNTYFTNEAVNEYTKENSYLQNIINSKYISYVSNYENILKYINLTEENQSLSNMISNLNTDGWLSDNNRTALDLYNAAYNNFELDTNTKLYDYVEMTGYAFSKEAYDSNGNLNEGYYISEDGKYYKRQITTLGESVLYDIDKTYNTSFSNEIIQNASVEAFKIVTKSSDLAISNNLTDEDINILSGEIIDENRLSELHDMGFLTIDDQISLKSYIEDVTNLSNINLNEVDSTIVTAWLNDKYGNHSRELFDDKYYIDGNSEYSMKMYKIDGKIYYSYDEIPDDVKKNAYSELGITNYDTALLSSLDINASNYKSLGEQISNISDLSSTNTQGTFISEVAMAGLCITRGVANFVERVSDAFSMWSSEDYSLIGDKVDEYMQSDEGNEALINEYNEYIKENGSYLGGYDSWYNAKRQELINESYNPVKETITAGNTKMFEEYKNSSQYNTDLTSYAKSETTAKILYNSGIIEYDDGYHLQGSNEVYSSLSDLINSTEYIDASENLFSNYSANISNTIISKFETYKQKEMNLDDTSSSNYVTNMLSSIISNNYGNTSDTITAINSLLSNSTIDTNASTQYKTMDYVKINHVTNLYELSSTTNTEISSLKSMIADINLKISNTTDESVLSSLQEEKAKYEGYLQNDYSALELAANKTVATWGEELQEKTLIQYDNLMGQVFTQIGEMAPSILLSTVPIAGATLSKAALWLSAYGGACEEALNNGASYNDTLQYSFFSATNELLSEHIFSGIGGVGEDWGDDVVRNLLNRTGLFNSIGGQKLSEYLIKGIGEGSEEIITDLLLTPIAESITYKNTESVGDLIIENNSLSSLANTFAVSFISSILMGGFEVHSKFKNYSNIKTNIVNSIVSSNPSLQSQIDTINMLADEVDTTIASMIANEEIDTTTLNYDILTNVINEVSSKVSQDSKYTDLQTAIENARSNETVNVKLNDGNVAEVKVDTLKDIATSLNIDITNDINTNSNNSLMMENYDNFEQIKSQIVIGENANLIANTNSQVIVNIGGNNIVLENETYNEYVNNLGISNKTSVDSNGFLNTKNNSTLKKISESIVSDLNTDMYTNIDGTLLKTNKVTISNILNKIDNKNDVVINDKNELVITNDNTKYQVQELLKTSRSSYINSNDVVLVDSNNKMIATINQELLTETLASINSNLNTIDEYNVVKVDDKKLSKELAQQIATETLVYTNMAGALYTISSTKLNNIMKNNNITDYTITSDTHELIINNDVDLQKYNDILENTNSTLIRKVSSNFMCVDGKMIVVDESFIEAMNDLNIKPDVSNNGIYKLNSIDYERINKEISKENYIYVNVDNKIIKVSSFKLNSILESMNLDNKLFMYDDIATYTIPSNLVDTFNEKLGNSSFITTTSNKIVINSETKKAIVVDEELLHESLLYYKNNIDVSNGIIEVSDSKFNIISNAVNTHNIYVNVDGKLYEINSLKLDNLIKRYKIRKYEIKDNVLEIDNKSDLIKMRNALSKTTSNLIKETQNTLIINGDTKVTYDQVLLNEAIKLGNYENAFTNKNGILYVNNIEEYNLLVKTLKTSTDLYFKSNNSIIKGNSLVIQNILKIYNQEYKINNFDNNSILDISNISNEALNEILNSNSNLISVYDNQVLFGEGYRQGLVNIDVFNKALSNLGLTSTDLIENNGIIKTKFNSTYNLLNNEINKLTRANLLEEQGLVEAKIDGRTIRFNEELLKNNASTYDITLTIDNYKNLVIEDENTLTKIKLLMELNNINSEINKTNAILLETNDSTYESKLQELNKTKAEIVDRLNDKVIENTEPIIESQIEEEKILSDTSPIADNIYDDNNINSSFSTFNDIDSMISEDNHSALYYEFENNPDYFGVDQGEIRKILMNKFNLSKFLNNLNSMTNTNAAYNTYNELISKLNISNDEFINKFNRYCNYYKSKGLLEQNTIDDIKNFVNLIEKNCPNISKKDAFRVLTLLESDNVSDGICNYAAVCNLIFNKYIGKAQQFEKDFGFPLYVNGKLNSTTLILDMFTRINNGGIIKNVNGKYDIDFNNKNYRNLSNWSTGLEQDLLNNYFNSKNLQFNIDSNCIINTLNTNNISSDFDVNDTILKIKNDLKQNKNLTLTLIGLDFYNSKNKLVSKNCGSHIVTIVGVSNDNKIIVDSWGEKLYIDLEKEKEKLVNKSNKKGRILISSYDIQERTRLGSNTISNDYNYNKMLESIRTLNYYSKNNMINSTQYINEYNKLSKFIKENPISFDRNVWNDLDIYSRYDFCRIMKAQARINKIRGEFIFWNNEQRKVLDNYFESHSGVLNAYETYLKTTNQENKNTLRTKIKDFFDKNPVVNIRSLDIMSYNQKYKCLKIYIANADVNGDYDARDFYQREIKRLVENYKYKKIDEAKDLYNNKYKKESDPELKLKYKNQLISIFDNYPTTLDDEIVNKFSNTQKVEYYKLKYFEAMVKNNQGDMQKYRSILEGKYIVNNNAPFVTNANNSTKVNIYNNAPINNDINISQDLENESIGSLDFDYNLFNSVITSTETSQQSILDNPNIEYIEIFKQPGIKDCVRINSELDIPENLKDVIKVEGSELVLDTLEGVERVPIGSVIAFEKLDSGKMNVWNKVNWETTTIEKDGLFYEIPKVNKAFKLTSEIPSEISEKLGENLRIENGKYILKTAWGESSCDIDNGYLVIYGENADKTLDCNILTKGTPSFNNYFINNNGSEITLNEYENRSNIKALISNLDNIIDNNLFDDEVKKIIDNDSITIDDQINILNNERLNNSSIISSIVFKIINNPNITLTNKFELLDNTNVRSDHILSSLIVSSISKDTNLTIDDAIKLYIEHNDITGYSINEALSKAIFSTDKISIEQKIEIYLKTCKSENLKYNSAITYILNNSNIKFNDKLKLLNNAPSNVQDKIIKSIISEPNLTNEQIINVLESDISDYFAERTYMNYLDNIFDSFTFNEKLSVIKTKQIMNSYHNVYYISRIIKSGCSIDECLEILSVQTKENLNTDEIACSVGYKIINDPNVSNEQINKLNEYFSEYILNNNLNEVLNENNIVDKISESKKEFEQEYYIYNNMDTLTNLDTKEISHLLVTLNNRKKLTTFSLDKNDNSQFKIIKSYINKSILENNITKVEEFINSLVSEGYDMNKLFQVIENDFSNNEIINNSNYIKMFKDVYDRITKTNAIELKDTHISGLYIKHAFQTNNPMKVISEIESIFLKNNLPYIGKAYKSFEIIQSTIIKGNISRLRNTLDYFKGEKFNDKSTDEIYEIIINDSNISTDILEGTSYLGAKQFPAFKDKTINEINSNLYNDLIKISLQSNEPTIMSYIENIEIGDKLFKNIHSIEDISKLSIEEKEILNTYKSHLDMLYFSLKGRSVIDNKVVNSIENSDEKLYESIKRLNRVFETIKHENIPNMIIKTFLNGTEFKTMNDVKEYANNSFNNALIRNIEFANNFENGKLTVQKGDLIKASDEIYLFDAFNNGFIPTEIIPTTGDITGDATPLGADFWIVNDLSNGMNINDIMVKSGAKGFKPIRFVINNNYSNDIIYETNVFSGEIAPAVDIRTGISFTDIKYFTVSQSEIGNDLNRLKSDIAKKGLYIPIVNDETGNLIYTYNDYLIERNKLQGTKYNKVKYESKINSFNPNYYFESMSNNDSKLVNIPIMKYLLKGETFNANIIQNKELFNKLVTSNLTKLDVNELDTLYNSLINGEFDSLIMNEYSDDFKKLDILSKINALDITRKRNHVITELNSALSELDLTKFGKLEIVTGLQSDISNGIVEVIDTGSTGRYSNVLGDGDFDFTVRIDNAIYNNQELFNEFKEKILDKFSNRNRELSTMSNSGPRFKEVIIPGLDTSIDIDISYTRRYNHELYSSDMSLKDRYDSMDDMTREITISEVVRAKKLFKDNHLYKPQKSDSTQAGLGGIGVENWILQNGGSLTNAIKSWVEASKTITFDEWIKNNPNGNYKDYVNNESNIDFADFINKYSIIDTGENHFSIGTSELGHDNFVVNNITSDSYQRFNELFKNYISKNINEFNNNTSIESTLFDTNVNTSINSPSSNYSNTFIDGDVIAVRRNLKSSDLNDDVHSALYYEFDENADNFGVNQGAIRELFNKIKFDNFIYEMNKISGNNTASSMNELISKFNISDDKFAQEFVNYMNYYTKKGIISKSSQYEIYGLIGHVQQTYPDLEVKDIFRTLLLLEGESVNRGVCNYAAATNLIFNKYIGKAEQFEKDFGFPLYDNGKLNDMTLMTEMFIHLNMGGIIQKQNGKYYIDYTNKNYKGFANFDSFDISMFNDYFKFKGIDFRINIYDIIKQTDTNIDSNMIKVSIKNALNQNKNVTLTLSGLDLYNEDNSIFTKDCGGHIVTVVGVSNDGRIIVDSWGKKLYINIEKEKSRIFASPTYTTFENNVRYSNQRQFTFDFYDIEEKNVINAKKPKVNYSIENKKRLLNNYVAMVKQNRTQTAEYHQTFIDLKNSFITEPMIFDRNEWNNLEYVGRYDFCRLMRAQYAIQKNRSGFEFWTNEETKLIENYRYEKLDEIDRLYDLYAKTNQEYYRQQLLSILNNYSTDLDELYSGSDFFNRLSDNKKLEYLNLKYKESIVKKDISAAKIYENRANVIAKQLLNKEFDLIHKLDNLYKNNMSYSYEYAEAYDELAKLVKDAKTKLNINIDNAKISTKIDLYKLQMFKAKVNGDTIELNKWKNMLNDIYSSYEFKNTNDVTRLYNLYINESNLTIKESYKKQVLKLISDSTIELNDELIDDFKLGRKIIYYKLKYIESKLNNDSNAINKYLNLYNKADTELYNHLNSPYPSINSSYNDTNNDTTDSSVDSILFNQYSLYEYLNSNSYILNIHKDKFELMQKIEELKKQSDSKVEVERLNAELKNMFKTSPIIINEPEMDKMNINDQYYLCKLKFKEATLNNDSAMKQYWIKKRNEYLDNYSSIEHKIVNELYSQYALENNLTLKENYRQQLLDIFSKYKTDIDEEILTKFSIDSKMKYYELKLVEAKINSNADAIMKYEAIQKKYYDSKLSDDTHSALYYEFENNPDDFGVDQGDIREIFNNINFGSFLNSMNTSNEQFKTYNELIAKLNISDSDFMTSFENHCNSLKSQNLILRNSVDELNRIMNVVERLCPGISKKDTLRILTLLEADTEKKGICNYAVVCNLIFNKYIGKAQQFEKDFGFPLYVKGKLNNTTLITEMFVKLNLGGIIKNENGNYTINYSNLEYRNLSPGGYGIDKFLLKEYFDYKNLKFDINHHIICYSELAKLYNVDDVIFEIKNSLDLNKNVTLTLSGLNLHDEVGNIFSKDCGPHVVTVAGISIDGRIIVDSWGKKLYIDLKESNDLILNDPYYVYKENGKEIKLNRKIEIDSYEIDENDVTTSKKLNSAHEFYAKKAIMDKLNELVKNEKKNTEEYKESYRELLYLYEKSPTIFDRAEWNSLSTTDRYNFCELMKLEANITGIKSTQIFWENEQNKVIDKYFKSVDSLLSLYELYTKENDISAKMKVRNEIIEFFNKNSLFDNILIKNMSYEQKYKFYKENMIKAKISNDITIANKFNTRMNDLVYKSNQKKFKYISELEKLISENKTNTNEYNNIITELKKLYTLEPDVIDNYTFENMNINDYVDICRIKYYEGLANNNQPEMDYWIKLEQKVISKYRYDSEKEITLSDYIINKMSLDQKYEYYRIKNREAKISNDEVSLNKYEQLMKETEELILKENQTKDKDTLSSEGRLKYDEYKNGKFQVYTKDYNGITIKFYSPDGKLTSKSQARLDEMEKAFKETYDKLPDFMQKTYKEVYLFDGIRNPQDDYWAVQYNIPGFKSAATAGNNCVYVWDSTLVSDSILIHETGHLIDQNCSNYTNLKGLSDNNVITDGKLWKYLMDNYDENVSSYAKCSSAENFAESIMRYFTNKENMKTKCPARYLFIDTLMNDIKNGTSEILSKEFEDKLRNISLNNNTKINKIVNLLKNNKIIQNETLVVDTLEEKNITYEDEKNSDVVSYNLLDKNILPKVDTIKYTVGSVPKLNKNDKPDEKDNLENEFNFHYIEKENSFVNPSNNVKDIDKDEDEEDNNKNPNNNGGGSTGGSSLGNESVNNISKTNKDEDISNYVSNENEIGSNDIVSNQDNVINKINDVLSNDDSNNSNISNNNYYNNESNNKILDEIEELDLNDVYEKINKNDKILFRLGADTNLLKVKKSLLIPLLGVGLLGTILGTGVIINDKEENSDDDIKDIDLDNYYKDNDDTILKNDNNEELDPLKILKEERDKELENVES